jgi:hypothetical protein
MEYWSIGVLEEKRKNRGNGGKEWSIGVVERLGLFTPIGCIAFFNH